MAQKKSKKPYAVKFHLTHAWTKDTIGKVTHFSIGKLKFFKREVFFVQVYYDAARKGTVASEFH